MKQTSFSPPTRRVVSVLAALASVESASASAIAVQLGISGSTCALVLNELAVAGWVERRPDKSYVLGPGILPVVDGLRSRYPLLGAGHEVIRALRAESGFGTSLTEIGPAGLTVLDVAIGDPAASRPSLGEKMPFSPPWGSVAMAWRAPMEIEAWLDTSAVPIDAAARRRHHAVLAGIRDTGWGVWRHVQPDAELIRQLSDLLTSASANANRADLRQMAALFSPLVQESCLPSELTGPGPYSVGYVVAGAFGPDARPRYQVEVHVLSSSVDGARLREVLGLVEVAASTLTDCIGGVRPSNLLPPGVR
ncbi:MULTISPECIES: MarR family transcriptional regulator [unclassified Nocardioides]|uniref:MarR family transcriptional regulator n=1 Tax=unclassified Nocardioides TaxID=2615069 RepID=UPI000700900B|nr:MULTISPECIES: MarR family transcriptional regulator [unclassified Nocardioides]KRA31305.1 hypothetical protein ASD81_17825 [Nocardioides sp. Root614]KRA87926.1 hypothetical protein ASD84_18100 [Nocardioides sp. Root682]